MNTRILIILCLSTLVAMLGMGILIPIFPFYAKNLGASGTMLGIIFSSGAASFAIANPIVGKISERTGYKLLIALGSGIRVPIAVSYTFATNPYHLIIIRLIDGALTAMVFNSAGAYIGSLAPKGKEGSYMGIFNTAYLLGFGVGPLIGGALTDLYNMDMPFYWMAGFLTFSTFLVSFFIPQKDKRLDSNDKENTSAEKRPIKKMMESELIKGLLIIGFILSFVQGTLMVFLPIIAEEENLSLTLIGILSASLLLVTGILQPPSGYLANRFNKIFLIITGILLVSVILPVIPLCHTFGQFFTLSIIGAIGCAIGNPAALALLVRGAKDLGFSLGVCIGIFSLACGIGLITGPVLSGVIMDMFSLNEIFYVISALCLLSAFVIYHYTRNLKDN